MTDTWWQTTSGPQLAQGDLLRDCHLPVFVDPTPDVEQEIDLVVQNLIVVTQSCDLENGKVQFAALCPIHTLDEFAEENPHFKTVKNWEMVRRGQKHSLHFPVLYACRITLRDCQLQIV
jgi:hypothetical protein